MRVIISLSVQQKWSLNAIDIKTPFLQSKNRSRDIYVVPPKEAKRNSVWKLDKCIYGLVDASHVWYDSIKAFLLSIHLHMSRLDAALFYFVHENHVCGFIALHVDDIIWARNSKFAEAVINKLRTRFLIGKENNIPFHYLGLDISSTNPNEVTLPQYHYVRDLNVENDLSSQEDQVR